MPTNCQNLSPGEKAIVEAIDGFEKRQAQREEAKHGENKQQIDAILHTQKKMQSDIEGLSEGFPNNDPAAHRRYHESLIEWRELRNKMVREALIQAGKVGGLAGVGWLLYAIWSAFKMEIMR